MLVVATKVGEHMLDLKSEPELGLFLQKYAEEIMQSWEHAHLGDDLLVEGCSRMACIARHH